MKFIFSIIVVLSALPALGNSHLIDFSADNFLDFDTLEINIDYQYEVMPGLTIGPKLFFTGEGSVGEIDQQYVGIGLAAFYKISGNWYLNAEASHVETKTFTAIDEVKDSGLLYSLGFGYHWAWDTFSLKIGLALTETEIDYEDSTVNTADGNSGASGFAFGEGSEIEPVIRVGWAF